MKKVAKFFQQLFGIDVLIKQQQRTNQLLEGILEETKKYNRAYGIR